MASKLSRNLRVKINNLLGVWNFINKKDKLNNFPNIVNIELNSTCQLKCIMCPMNTGIVKRKKTLMSKQTFKNIIDKYNKYLCRINLSHHGEPLLHKDLTWFISYLTKRGIRTSITTNALLLTKKKSKELIESGLNEIMFSFDCLNKDKFERLRQGSHFDIVLANINDFIKINKNVQVVIRTIDIDMLKGEDIKLMNEIEKKGVLVIKDIFNTWGGRIDPKSYKKDFKEDVSFKCIQPWTNAIINSEAKLCVCNNQEDDNFGSVIDKDIMDIWNSKKLRQLRKDIIYNHQRTNSLCKKCSYYDCNSLFFEKNSEKNSFYVFSKYLINKVIQKINRK